MEFYEVLNGYMEKLGCTNKELADLSELSAETIGRYRKGIRSPQKSGEVVEKIAGGLYLISKKRKIKLNENEIARQLLSALNDGISVDFRVYTENLRKLVEVMEISNSELAKVTNFDPSYISRVLSGKRKPSQLKKFNTDIAFYAARRIYSTPDKDIIRKLGISTEDEESEVQLANKIFRWLGSNDDIRPQYKIDAFLTKLDEFDLDEYITAIHFDQNSIPALPFRLQLSRKGSGLKAMMEMELDFIRATITSESKEGIIFYSDMPMEEMSQDKEFAKKWIFGTAMMLKKGLHMHIIHDVNRPFEEMMLGLESYVPMYMTGQISPYYLKKSQSEVFRHLIKVSGAAALSGEAISRHHNDGRYYLSCSREELTYYRKRAQQLLECARPLMEIYDANRRTEFERFFRDTVNVPGERKIICGSLPAATLPEELCERLFEKNNISPVDADNIRRFIKNYKNSLIQLLEREKLTLEIPFLTKEQFDKKPLTVSLSEIFCNKALSYSYEDYLEHMKSTEALGEQYEKCSVRYNYAPGFRNINIVIIGKKEVIVSKNKSPSIHFVIYHPRMIEAFRNLSFPITDTAQDEQI